MADAIVEIVKIICITIVVLALMGILENRREKK